MSDDNVIEALSVPTNPPVIIGRRNHLKIGKDCSLGCLIEILGDDNQVLIEDNVYYNQGWLGVRCSNAFISIGRGTTIGGATISAHESARITIGADSMLSVDVFMDVSDMHPIFDSETGERINPAVDIAIGSHVWIGYRAILIKGVSIADGSIIAAGSVVTGNIPGGCVAAGNPARVIREKVQWRRNFAS